MKSEWTLFCCQIWIYFLKRTYFRLLIKGVLFCSQMWCVQFWCNIMGVGYLAIAMDRVELNAGCWSCWISKSTSWNSTQCWSNNPTDNTWLLGKVSLLSLDYLSWVVHPQITILLALGVSTYHFHFKLKPNDIFKSLALVPQIGDISSN